MRPLLLSLFLLGCHSLTTTTESAATVTAPTVATQTVDVSTAEGATREGAFFVDVRSPEEYASGHAAHTINVPLDMLDTQMYVFEAHKDDPIYLICRSGHRSGLATDNLTALGYHAINVKGGTNAWKAARLPME